MGAKHGKHLLKLGPDMGKLHKIQLGTGAKTIGTQEI